MAWPVLIRLLATRGAARNVASSGGAANGAGSNLLIDVSPIGEMLQKLGGEYEGDKNPEEMEKIVKTMASLVLGRTARDLGVTQPKGKFSKTFSKGISHVKKRYTWKLPAKRGSRAGQLPKQYEHVAKKVKIGGREFKLYKYLFYERQGATTLVTNGLTRIREDAMSKVGSGKAIWYKIAKDAKLQVSGLKGGLFADRGMLIKSLRAMGAMYRKTASGRQIRTNDELVIEVKSHTNNALNPHVKGKKTFQTKINGIKSEFGTLIRKGYIENLNDVAKEFGMTS